MTVYDSNSNPIVDSQWVTVVNGPPKNIFFYTNPWPSFPGMEVSGYGEFTDYGSDPFTCTVNWGDGSTEETFTTGPGETYYNLPPHIYTAAGIYTITLSVTDSEGASSSGSATHDVVHVFAQSEYETYWPQTPIQPPLN